MKFLKWSWRFLRVVLEASAALYVAVWPVVLVRKFVELSEDAEVVLVLALVFLIVFCLEVLWWRIFKRKPSASVSVKGEPPIRLTPAAPPRPTGNSTYIMLKPAAALKAKDYVMLDTETTGLSRTADRIIEIGMLKCVDDKVVDTYTTFVNPDMHIPTRISRLTGITDVDVINAPQFDAIAREVMEFIGDLPVVGHNVHFDAGMLTSELNYLGLDYVFNTIDTVALSRRAFPELHDHKLRTLIDQLNLAGHVQQHRALDDAEVTHRLFLKCKGVLSK